MKTLVALTLLGLATATSPAQLIFSTGQNGVDSTIFQQLTPGGAVTQIDTGLVHSNYASVSRDGRFVTFSSPDPTEPVSQVLPSSDIYRYDRSIGQTFRVFDYTTSLQTNPSNGSLTTTTFLPEFNALSPNGVYLVSSVRLTQRTGIADPQRVNNLNIIVTGGGTGTVENGRGNFHDFHFSEFAGISWAPDSLSFVTPAYVPTVAGNNNALPGIGIVRFSLSNQGIFVRSQILSQPTFNGNFSGSIQIFPAISPSGIGLAYWDIFFPDSAGLSQPATAQLIVANADGSNATIRTTFAAGIFPADLAWSADGSQLVFSIGNQQQVNGQFPAGVVPSTAVIRSVASSGSNTVSQLPGIDGGFLPSISVTGGGGGGNIDLSQITLSLTPSGGDFTLRADGLNPTASYVLESGITASSFSNPATFTGAQVMGGIPITKNGNRAFFRLRNP